MSDVFSRSKRSAVMSAIRGSGNRTTEVRLILLMREQDITGWRRSQSVFGRPDFVFRRQKVAVFVDGCFWHRHSGCRYAYIPKSRRDFWLEKFGRTIARDRQVDQTLTEMGWHVTRIWECSLRHPDRAVVAMRNLEMALRNNQTIKTN